MMLLAKLLALFLVSTLSLGQREAREAAGDSKGTEKLGGVVEKWSGKHSAEDKEKGLVVNTAEDWRRIWERAYAKESPRPALPQIDFEKHMVVAFFDGAKPSSGYDVMIEKAEVKADRLHVQVTVTEPRKGSLTATTIEHPFCLAVVPKTKAAPTFHKETRTREQR